MSGSRVVLMPAEKTARVLILTMLDLKFVNYSQRLVHTRSVITLNSLNHNNYYSV